MWGSQSQKSILVCLPHKATTPKIHELPPYHGTHCSQFLGGDEDCGDDDDYGSQFHNRNNLNQDELGGALPSVSERADQAQLKNTWVRFEGFRLKSKVEKYWKWVGNLTNKGG